MSLVKYEPNRSVVPFAGTLSRFFDDLFPSTFGVSDLPAMTYRPSVDIVENDDNVIIKADMPGMDKGDIRVVVDDGLLTIEGSRREEHEEKDKGLVRSERFVGTFRRSFNLPTWADTAKIGANYKNGVLEVKIPKSETAKPKEVEIKIG